MRRRGAQDQAVGRDRQRAIGTLVGGGHGAPWGLSSGVRDTWETPGPGDSEDSNAGQYPAGVFRGKGGETIYQFH